MRRPVVRRILIVMSPYGPVRRRPLPNSPFNVPEADAPPAESYAVSDQVSHDKYGLGTIIGVEDGVSVIVDFRSHKQRLSTPCAKLIKL